MISYKGILGNLAWRFVLALLVIGVGVLVIKRGLDGGVGKNPYDGSQYYFFGLAIFVIAAIIMGTPLARLVAEFMGNIIYPSDHYNGPQPVYGIPEAKRMKGRYQEAFDSLQKLSQEFPQELKAYIEMIDIAIMDMKNPELASSVYHRGMETLKEEKAKDNLSRMYMEISTKIDSPEATHAGN